MKRILIFFAPFVLLTFSFCGRSNMSIDDQIVDSCIDQKNGMLYYENFLNSDNRIVRSKAFYYDTINKVDVLSGVDEFWYDEFGNIVKELFYVPDENLEIKPLELDSFYYNEIGLPIEIINFVSSGDMDIWMKVTRHTYFYKNDDTLKSSEAEFSWDSEKNIWIPQKEFYYGYDSLGRIVSQLSYQLDPKDTSKVKEDFQQCFYPDTLLINE